ncbi:MAG: peptidylprolyl isomerase [Gammaproteobacteria bacterium]|nr:peptidylprolyl isomerase [Gammaproteobacteria bacterium]
MRLITRITCLGLFLVVGFQSTAMAADKTVATVNGKKIGQQQYDQFISVLKAKNPKFDVGSNRQAIINELVNREILFQEAKKQKVDKDPKIAYVLEQQRVDLMVKALVQKALSKDPVKEKQLKKLYKEKVAGANLQEYKARHILLKTEDEAKTIIAKLDAGGDFAELAKEKSTGPSAKSGGDLGWFRPAQMVPPFSRAVAEMKKGEHTSKPVKTNFGWHVIKLEDSRKSEPPKFDDVKKQLEASVNQQRLQDYVMKLRNKAKVKIK